MADRDDATTTEKVRPPRFGRGVERPRCAHAREMADRADALMADIDTVLTRAGHDS
jgi:hypothetical protein